MRAKTPFAAALLSVLALSPLSPLLAQQDPVATAAPDIPATRPTTAPPMPSISPEEVAARQRGNAGPNGPIAPARGRAGFAAAPASRPSTAARSPADGPTCAFDATMYDVRLPADQLGRLDIDALSKTAPTSEAFEKALASLGTTRPIYRANQGIGLGEESYINVTSQVPYVTNTSIRADGQAINTIAYRTTGGIIDLIPKAGPEGVIDVELSVQASVLIEGPTPIAGAVKAPLFRTAQTQGRRSVTPNQPFVLVNADAANLDADGKAVAIITRITFGPPQVATTQPGK